MPLIAGIVAAVAGTFLYRFLTIDFTNDHYVHLSRGWQILQGEVPTRDFFDPGLVLQYYASAAALLWSGHNLFGEAILTVGFMAAGAGLAFAAAALLSRSVWLAAAGTTIATLSLPRLYNYPKTFLYVMAIVAAWGYAARPGRGGLIGLAVLTAVAFLFRHDHGVYIGASVVVMLVLRHWGDTTNGPAEAGHYVRPVLMPVAQYAAVALLLVSPFLLFIQLTRGLPRYIQGSGSQFNSVTTFRINRLPLHFDLTAPLVIVAPPSRPRVNVRWRNDVDEAARRDLERGHELLNPLHHEGTTWSYELTHTDTAHIGALVTDPAVDDTNGIDRVSRVLPPEPLYVRLQRKLPPLRMRLLPGFFSADNGLAWLYGVTLVLPLAGVILLAVLIVRRDIERPEAAAAGMACLLCLIIVQTLVRSSPDSRLADIANPIAVAGAWVGARSIRLAGGRPLLRRALTTVVAVVVAITVGSVWVYANVSTNLENSGILNGPVAVWRQAETIASRLKSRPIDGWTRTSPGLGGLLRYVFECTTPTDRLLVTGFAPDAFFITERAFAGGQVYLIDGWHYSPADQRLTIERLERQRVPIVIERTGWNYQQHFPILADYIGMRYRYVPLPADSMRALRVLVDRGLTPTGSYEPLGTPCYR
jgi:hypothetical protein